MCIRRFLGSISGEQPPIIKDLGLCYFMEFSGVVDAGVRSSFALKESESQLTRFISFQNFCLTVLDPLRQRGPLSVFLLRAENIRFDGKNYPLTLKRRRCRYALFQKRAKLLFEPDSC
jgi:hypothetical protein